MWSMFVAGMCVMNAMRAMQDGPSWRGAFNVALMVMADRLRMLS